jgi:hypothetical protein
MILKLISDLILSPVSSKKLKHALHLSFHNFLYDVCKIIFFLFLFYWFLSVKTLMEQFSIVLTLVITCTYMQSFIARSM